MRDLELDATRRKLDGGPARPARPPSRWPSSTPSWPTAIVELNEALDVILTLNKSSVHSPGLRRTAPAHHRAPVAGSPKGQRRTLLIPEEAGVLAVPRGSLTDAERREIQQHVDHTFQYLAQIPWTREFRRIPEIARSHHEKLTAPVIRPARSPTRSPCSQQSRMMTIGEIDDALTASDRP